MVRIITTLFLILTVVTVLFAMAPPQGEGQGSPRGGGFGSLLVLFIPLLLIWYFLLIRPQQKKEKEKQLMLQNLSKGDEVITIGGIYGKITQIKENKVIIKIADKVNIEVAKSAISGKVSK